MMDEKTRKDLEAAHKKAMDAIKTFNKEAKDTINLGKKKLGL